MRGKCKFNQLWLLDVAFTKWLAPVDDDKHKAFCKWCKSKFDISHSGIGCIRSHAKGKSHGKLSNSLLNGSQRTLTFKSSTPEGNSNMEIISQDAAASTSSAEVKSLQYSDGMKNYLVKDQTTKAEIIWALNSVLTHTSNRSGGNTSDLFKIMFPDSIIADKFQMHKDKLGYVISYGLGPFFQNELVNDLRKLDFFCLSIDESLNKVAQKGQMDIIVRYWDELQNIIRTRYLSSMFLGHSKATDLLEAFTSCLNSFGLPLSKVLQVETDGPNVNLKFLRDFDEHVKTEQDNARFDIGTCSLHVVHGCYKTALENSKWDVNTFLRAAYFLFKDFPSRRADFQHLSGSSKYPLKLCAIRWVENAAVIERALNIIPALKQYINGVTQAPASKNFMTVRKFLDDKLLEAKLYFLHSLTSELEHFLVLFQVEKPLVPHLYEELALLFKSLASRFLKNDLMSLENLRDILLIDLKNADNYLSSKKIDVGFGAMNALKDIAHSDKINFFRQCRDFLINFLEKLKLKSPLSKVFVKGLSCLSPEIMLSAESVKASRVTLALKEFIKKKHLTPIQADSIKKTYLKICEDPAVKEKLKTYNMKKNRLDEFLMKIFTDVDKQDPLLAFTRKALTMFHGNAAVERSFSVNKNCLVENLEEDSLIAQRCVHSAINHHGGIESVPVTAGMIKAFRSASGKRNDALQQKRLKKSTDEHAQKLAAAELKELKKRKLEIMQSAKDELVELDKKINHTEKKMKKCV